MRGFALGSTGRSYRNPHWDNIRYCSGTLIVLVHLTAPLLDLTAIRWLYLATWALRVPVFAMIAGYFSTAGPLTSRDTRKLTETVLVPYFLIGVLHTVQVRYYTGEWQTYIEDPGYAMWFLLALFFWRMSLPYLARLRHPLLLSVVAAVGVGYLGRVDQLYAASQTVAFLPFFLLGWMLRQGWGKEQMAAAWSRYVAFGVLVLAFGVSWVLLRDVQLIWLGMLRPYHQEALPVSLEWAWVIRGLILACGFVVALSFIRLVPQRRIPFVTYLGAGGFYIYLLHPLVLRPFELSGPGLDWVDSKPEQITAILLAAVLSAVLASPPVRAIARPIIQPKWPWLFSRAPETPPPEASSEARPKEDVRSSG